MRSVVLAIALTVGFAEVAAGQGDTYSCPTNWNVKKDFAAYLRTCHVIKRSTRLPESYRLLGYKNRARRETLRQLQIESGQD
jgi:hypothetical protein